MLSLFVLSARGVPKLKNPGGKMLPAKFSPVNIGRQNRTIFYSEDIEDVKNKTNIIWPYNTKLVNDFIDSAKNLRRFKSKSKTFYNFTSHTTKEKDGQKMAVLKGAVIRIRAGYNLENNNKAYEVVIHTAETFMNVQAQLQYVAKKGFLFMKYNKTETSSRDLKDTELSHIYMLQRAKLDEKLRKRKYPTRRNSTEYFAKFGNNYKDNEIEILSELTKMQPRSVIPFTLPTKGKIDTSKIFDRQKVPDYAVDFFTSLIPQMMNCNTSGAKSKSFVKLSAESPESGRRHFNLKNVRIMFKRGKNGVIKGKLYGAETTLLVTATRTFETIPTHGQYVFEDGRLTWGRELTKEELEQLFEYAKQKQEKIIAEKIGYQSNDYFSSMSRPISKPWYEYFQWLQ